MYRNHPTRACRIKKVGSPPRVRAMKKEPPRQVPAGYKWCTPQGASRDTNRPPARGHAGYKKAPPRKELAGYKKAQPPRACGIASRLTPPRYGGIASKPPAMVFAGYKRTPAMGLRDTRMPPAWGIAGYKCPPAWVFARDKKTSRKGLVG